MTKSNKYRRILSKMAQVCVEQLLNDMTNERLFPHWASTVSGEYFIRSFETVEGGDSNYVFAKLVIHVIVSLAFLCESSTWIINLNVSKYKLENTLNCQQMDWLIFNRFFF